jgi:hypothetical protein
MFCLLNPDSDVAFGIVLVLEHGLLPREEGKPAHDCFLRLIPATGDHPDSSRTKDDDEHEGDL